MWWHRLDHQASQHYVTIASSSKSRLDLFKPPLGGRPRSIARHTWNLAAKYLNENQIFLKSFCLDLYLKRIC